MNFRKTLIYSIFLLMSANLYSQDDSIKMNGYNIFYYPNGFKLSEGNFKNGKPNGYWTTYYVSGKKKSEGNRKNFLLDSTWVFYFENGDTSEIINYEKNKKSGYYYKYVISNRLDSYMASKELFVEDKKQGFSFYYYPSGKLKNKVEYVDNNKHGRGYEYNENGLLVAIEEYRYNNMISRKAVNRYNKSKEKVGKWVEVYDNGKVKSEMNYEKGMPNGIAKQYTPTGKLLRMEEYQNGKNVKSVKRPKFDTIQNANIKVDKKYYANGNLKSVRNYKDDLPFGMHIFYNENGTIKQAVLFNELGIKKGQGRVDSTLKKNGVWEFFYENGDLKAKGEYLADKRAGKWQFFYPNGVLEQEGVYEDGFFDGVWKWYYESGALLREENYFYGFREGQMFELSPAGDTIVKGTFVEGDKDGKWFYCVGDDYSVGKYNYGAKTGLWLSYYYPEMRLKVKENYSQGERTGKYKEYYINKKVKEFGNYESNKKDGRWVYNKPDGSVDFTAFYQYGEMIKINDEKIK